MAQIQCHPTPKSRILSFDPTLMHGSSQFSDLEPVAKAHRYAQCAATTVLVKHVVDSMAAGDSFNAGFLASRIVGQTIAQPVHAASVVATKVIQHRGALVTGL